LHLENRITKPKKYEDEIEYKQDTLIHQRIRKPQSRSFFEDKTLGYTMVSTEKTRQKPKEHIVQKARHNAMPAPRRSQAYAGRQISDEKQSGTQDFFTVARRARSDEAPCT
jgi:hypothetical protein